MMKTTEGNYWEWYNETYVQLYKWVLKAGLIKQSLQPNEYVFIKHLLGRGTDFIKD